MITEQPVQKVQPPTAQIQADEKKVDETITTTTQVEAQEQPTFQASSSVTHPEQPTQVMNTVVHLQDIFSCISIVATNCRRSDNND